MKTSFRIARIAGIDVNVHVTFGLIVLLGSGRLGLRFGPNGALFGALLMIVLFGCVVLHELGHALAARAFGIGVRDITLLPIGGVSRMEKNPDTPFHELVIAAAGPVVSLALAAALWAVTGVASSLGKLDPATILKSMTPGSETALLWLLFANLFLALFNLIPAFPMDGGRMLRAALAMFLGFGQATRVAAAHRPAHRDGCSGSSASSPATSSSRSSPSSSSWARRRSGPRSKARVVLGTTLVGDAYNRNAITLAPGAAVSQVVEHILTSYQPDFAVMQGTKLLGVVSREEILKSLATETGDVYVTGIMNRDPVRVEADMPLDDVRRHLAERGQRLAAVFRGETFLGLVSAEDIAEALLVISFSRAQEARRKAATTQA